MQMPDFIQYNSAKEAEEARVLRAAESSYTERFHTLMRLIRVSGMIKNAKIISSPVIPLKK
jgi:hypothetical protein